MVAAGLVAVARVRGVQSHVHETGNQIYFTVLFGSFKPPASLSKFKVTLRAVTMSGHGRGTCAMEE
jgi:hypothetical protein